MDASWQPSPSGTRLPVSFQQEGSPPEPSVPPLSLNKASSPMDSWPCLVDAPVGFEPVLLAHPLARLARIESCSGFHFRQRIWLFPAGPPSL